jgi:hypothetical protein
VTSKIFDVGFKNEDTISTISIIKTIYNKIFLNKGKDRFFEKKVFFSNFIFLYLGINN